MRFWAVLIVGLGLSACSHTPDTLPEKPIQKQQVKLSQRSPLKISCTSAREYVTTLEYLRAHQELGVNESQARKIADQVSRGCSGSAKRFVSVLELLIKSHIAGRNALESAVALSQLDQPRWGQVVQTPHPSAIAVQAMMSPKASSHPYSSCAQCAHNTLIRIIFGS